MACGAGFATMRLSCGSWRRASSGIAKPAPRRDATGFSGPCRRHRGGDFAVVNAGRCACRCSRRSRFLLRRRPRPSRRPGRRWPENKFEIVPGNGPRLVVPVDVDPERWRGCFRLPTADDRRSGGHARSDRRRGDGYAGRHDPLPDRVCAACPGGALALQVQQGPGRDPISAKSSTFARGRAAQSSCTTGSACRFERSGSRRGSSSGRHAGAARLCKSPRPSSVSSGGLSRRTPMAEATVLVSAP